MRRLRLKSLLRATSASLALLLVGGPAIGQLRPGAADRAKQLNQQAQQPDDKNNAAANAAANPAAQPSAAAAEAPQVIRHIVVRGTQRCEPGTVLT